jgi:hypothetical protein
MTIRRQEIKIYTRTFTLLSSIFFRIFFFFTTAVFNLVARSAYHPGQMDIDKVHHPNVVAGGCWMNSGFSTMHGAQLRDWEVSLQGVEVCRTTITKNA